MKNNRLLTLIAIAALMLACNLPTAGGQGAPPAGEPSVLATETPPAGPPTETPVPLPLDTPTVTPTPTPSVPQVTPLKDAVNCRFAPGTAYASIGSGLQPGNSAQVVGKSTDGGWWQIQNPTGGVDKCWVAASVTTATGDFTQVGVVAPPSPFVTSVVLTVKPESVNLGPGCSDPDPHFSFKGTIYVNGPVTVKWYFQTQEGGSMSEHSYTFTSFGFKEFSGDYSPSGPDKGNYWVRLVVTSPNSIFGEGHYQIKCS
jgi:hypothetical protein